MKFNTICLYMGYAESRKTASLIFQLNSDNDEERYAQSAIEAWNCFLNFLIKKYKLDTGWEPKNKNSCACNIENKSKMKYCSNCGFQLEMKNKNLVSVRSLEDYFLNLACSNGNGFGYEWREILEILSDKEMSPTISPWDTNFSFSSIYNPIIITHYAESILCSEIYRYSKEYDQEFFESLNQSNDWELENYLNKQFKQMLDVKETHGAI